MLRRLALALLVSSFAPAARALPAETWFVGVASNDGAAGDEGLLFAERDARELADVLRQRGGISSRRTTMLLGEDADTVRRALLDVNAAIRARAAQVPTALVVFYSGHADARALHLRGTELALDELKSLVEGSAASLRLLVVDACRSGAVTRVKGVNAAPPFELHLTAEVAPEGMAIITSSAAGESSQESDRLQGSFFTHHLVNALRGAADSDGDGRVTLAEAYAYAYAQTLRSSGQTLNLQHPTYSWDVKGRAELVLTESGSGDARMGRLRLDEQSVYLVSDRREGGTVVADVAPMAPRAVLSLPAGSYFVQQRNPGEFREYEVQLVAGQETDLARVPYQLVRYDRLVRKRGGGPSRTDGITLLGAGHGAVLAGESASAGLVVGYGVDFWWGSLGARLRGSFASGASTDRLLPWRHDEYGLGLTLQRFVDFEELSVGFGLLFEGIAHRQTFSGDRAEAPREALGAAFSGLLSMERHVADGLALRLEGGPTTLAYRQAVVDREKVQGTAWATPLSWWLSGGLVWRR